MLGRVLLFAFVVAAAARQQVLQPEQGLIQAGDCEFHSVAKRCAGLSSAGNDASASAEACANACCGDPSCDVYEFTANQGCFTGAADGCDLPASSAFPGVSGKKVKAGDCSVAYSQTGYIVGKCPVGTRTGTACAGVQCAPGYDGSLGGGVSCVDGGYTGVFTGCHEDCDEPYTQTGYVIGKCSTDKPKDHGTECKAACASGYSGNAEGSVSCVDSVYTGEFSGCSDCSNDQPGCAEFRHGCNCVAAKSGFHIENGRAEEDEVPGAPCAAGKSSNDGLAPGCEDCSTGEFSGAGADECSPCEPGTAAGAVGSSSCDVCAPGSYTNHPGQAECKSCPAGRFSASEGAKQCDACDQGTFSDEGASSCQSCPPGTSISIDGSDKCKTCNPGTFAANAGSRFCGSCPPGKIASAAGATECVDCEAGTFALNEGQDECGVCARNTYSEAGAVTCADCPKGEESEEGSGACSPIDG